MIDGLYNQSQYCHVGYLQRGLGLVCAAIADWAALRSTRYIDQVAAGMIRACRDAECSCSYFFCFKGACARSSRPIISEYGGYSYPVKGILCEGRQFGYKMFFSREKFTEVLEAFRRQLAAHRPRPLRAVYTSSPMWRPTTVFTYDRRVVKIDLRCCVNNAELARRMPGLICKRQSLTEERNFARANSSITRRRFIRIQRLSWPVMISWSFKPLWSWSIHGRLPRHRCGSRPSNRITFSGCSSPSPISSPSPLRLDRPPPRRGDGKVSCSSPA